MLRLLAGSLGLIGLMTGCGASEPTAQHGAELREVSLTDTILGETGIGFGLHPTEVAIRISAESNGDLMVCPADGAGGIDDPAADSWGDRWAHVGCRELGEDPLELPSTSGDQHVGIRIVAAAEETSASITIEWVPADPYFAYQPGPMGPGEWAGLTLTLTDAGDLSGFVKAEGAWELEFHHDQEPAGRYRGSGDAANVTFATVDQPGVLDMRYSNRGTTEQWPQIYLDWPRSDEAQT